MPGKKQFMTELKMKEMQLINWFGCPNLIYTRERIHLVAMLTTDEEMKKNSLQGMQIPLQEKKCISVSDHV